MPGFTKNRVDSENRVRVPASLGAVRLEKRPVSFVPLAWQRKLLVDPEEVLHAWILCNLDGHASDGPEWIILPRELDAYAGDDEEKLHLSALIATVSRPTGYGKGGLRVQIPENLRAMGWLPERNEEIVVLSDPVGVSVWRPEVFEKHSIAMIRSYAGAVPGTRPSRARIPRSGGDR